MSASAGPFAIGVDIGGTFTDVVCLDPAGHMRLLKLPTTPRNPSAGAIEAVGFMRRQWHIPPDAIARFVHGTTIATNAVLERKGARIGLITTAGFKDVLEIGRQMRRAMYDLVLQPETPVFLAPGAFRKEVPERIGPAGEVLVPLDEAAVARVVGELAAEGVEAIAVCYLFSFVNPAHELRTREIISHLHPELMVSLSCEVDPAFREYERTCVTAFDAYVKPVVGRYLEAMERDLAGAGVGAPLQIMQSRGGVCSSSVARSRPVRLFLSGPAAGVVGALEAGRRVGLDDLITVDIGGTSCDVALVSGGIPLNRAESTIAGYSVRVPTRRYHHHRRGRRQHRLARCRRRIAGRSGIGRLGAGPGLLRSRRRRGNSDRRFVDPRLYRPGLFRRRLAEARSVPGARGHRADDRTAARNIGRGGGARDSPRPECPDVGGNPPRLNRPRHRPARLRAAAIGRRRPAARLRTGPRTRNSPHRRADSSWRALRRRPAVRADRARGIRRVPARSARRSHGRKSGRRSTASMRPAAG